MGNTQQLLECLPYYSSHFFLALWVLEGLQVPRNYLLSRDFLAKRGEWTASVLGVAVAAVDVDFGYQREGGLKPQDCGIQKSWRWEMRREKRGSVVIAVTEVVPQVPL
jgi:hypothetical protein